MAIPDDEIRLRVGPRICWARVALAVPERFLDRDGGLRGGDEEEDDDVTGWRWTGCGVVLRTCDAQLVSLFGQVLVVGINVGTKKKA